MIQGHHRSTSPCDMDCTSSTAGSQSETGEPDRKKSRWQPCTPEQWLGDSSGHPESSVDRGITNLPNEVVVKILSKLDVRTVSACRRVNTRWKALIDEHHLPALSFCRGLHYQPTPQTVKGYHSSTRDWLTGFGDEGEKLAEELDKHLEHKHFPKMLFFAIAKVLARTEHLTCHNVFTDQNHEYWVTDASVSPDGHQLVTVTVDGTARIWRFVDDQWQEKATIPHGYSVENASFSPDGHHLVTSSNPRTAKIWKFVNGQLQEKVTFKHSGWMIGPRFSPDGHHLVTVSGEKTVTIWGLVGGQWQEKDTLYHNAEVGYASFRSDGHQLVTASYDGTAKIWELAGDQWQEKATLPHDYPVKHASFSPDGHQLVTACWRSETAKIWELVGSQWQEKATLPHDHPVKSASFSPDGHHLITFLISGAAIIWGLVNSQWQKKPTHQDEQVIDANFSPDGHHLVTVSEDRTVNIWEPVDGATTQNLLANREKTPLQPGKTLAEKAENDDLPVKNEQLPVAQWKKKATIQREKRMSRVDCASFSPDGRQLVTTSFSTVKIWLVKGRGEESQGQK